METRKIHILKVAQPYWDAIQSGLKPWEFRKNDRNFQAGDYLHLKEVTQDGEDFTGRMLEAEITFMLNGPKFGLPEGYCVMTVSPTDFWTDVRKMPEKSN